MSYELTADAAAGDEFAVCVSGLEWHREIHRQSRFRWSSADVVREVRRATSGRLEFTEFHDLPFLESALQALTERSDYLLCHVAEPFVHARRLGGSGWDVARAWNITDQWLVGRLVISSPVAEDRRAMRMTKSLHQRRNPLVRGWELLQLWHMHDAARHVVQVAMAELTWELSGGSPLMSSKQRDQLEHAVEYLRSYGITEAPGPCPVPSQRYEGIELFTLDRGDDAVALG